MHSEMKMAILSVHSGSGSPIKVLSSSFRPSGVGNESLIWRQRIEADRSDSIAINNPYPLGQAR